MNIGVLCTYNIPVAVIQVRPQGGIYTFSITTPIAHRPRLEKLLYLELSRSPSGYLKPLRDPGGFASETAARRFQKLNAKTAVALQYYIAVSELERLQIYSGYM